MERITFSKKQIEALKQAISSCRECAVIDGEFSPYGFIGAIESQFKFLSEDSYLYFDDKKEVKNG